MNHLSMVYGLFRLGRLSHVKFEAGRVVQALIGKDEESAYIYPV
jgi:hypothetical protein